MVNISLLRLYVFPMTIILAVALVIVTSGVSIYNSTATTFRLQNDIRIAQNTRDRIVRVHRANKSDVQAYAAASDISFIKKISATSAHLYRRLQPDVAVLSIRLA